MLGIRDSNQKIIADGLIISLDAAQRRSYPGSDTTWTDLSGKGNNFTLTNGPTFNSSNGGAIVFDGTNDFTYGAASNSFGIGQNFTLEIVATVASIAGYTTQWGFWFGSSGGQDRGISAHLKEDSQYITNSVVFDTMGYDTVNGNRISYSPAPALNTINWYAFRYRNTTTPYKNIFLNGSSVANSGTNTPTAISLSTDTAKVPGNAYNIWFNGTIFLFRMYNRALSDTELTQNFNAQRSRFNL